MQFYDFKEIEERVILIGVQTEQDEDVAASLDELEELARCEGGAERNIEQAIGLFGADQDRKSVV